MEELKNVLRERLKYFFRFWIFGIIYALCVFGIFMLGRTMKDEHIRGAFALFPVASILTVFYILLIFEYLKEKKKKKD